MNEGIEVKAIEISGLKQSLVRLDDIAKSIFGLSREVARRKASLGLLPIAAWRFGGQKTPYFVTKESLQCFVDEKVKDAEKLRKQMQSVSL